MSETNPYADLDLSTDEGLAEADRRFASDPEHQESVRQLVEQFQRTLGMWRQAQENTANAFGYTFEKQPNTPPE